MSTDYTSMATLPPTGKNFSDIQPPGTKPANPSYNNSTAISCTANLANTILGAGVLGLPHALASTGSLSGVILLTVAAYFSAIGLHLLSVCALDTTPPISKTSSSSFYSVATAAYPPATMLIDGAVAFKCFGVSTSYLTIIGDCMVDVMEVRMRQAWNALCEHTLRTHTSRTHTLRTHTL